MRGKTKKNAKNTILVYGEGKAEKAFLDHLSSIYGRKGFFFTIRKAHGGGVQKIVHLAIKETAEFERKIVKIDGDRAKIEIEEARRLCEKHSIELIISAPCLEAVLLEVIKPGKGWGKKSTKACKKELQTTIPASKMGDQRTYLKLFNKEQLNRARRNCAALDEIIRIFE